MIVLLELGLLLGAVALGWLAWRRGAVRNAALLGVSLCASAAASCVGYGLGAFAGAAGARTSTAVFSGLAAGLVVWGTVGVLLRRRLVSGDPSPIKRWEARWVEHPRTRVLVAGLTGVGALALALVVAFVGVNLLALRWPAFTEGGLALKRLRLAPPQPASAPRVDPDALERVAQRIGLRGVLDHYAALRVVLGLPTNQLRWLVARDAKLEQLMEHPALRELAGDSAFTQQLLDASAGSPRAVAGLLDSSRFDALRGDPALRRALGEVDLIRLQQRVERRQQRGFPLPLQWSERALGVTPQVGRAEPWSRYRLGALAQLDPRAVALEAVSVWVSEHGGAQELRLRPPGNGRVRAWLNGAPLDLVRQSDWRSASWTALPRQRFELRLLLEPGDELAGWGESWAVEVIPEPPTRRVPRADPAE